MNYLQKTVVFVRDILREIERKHLSLVAAGLAYFFLMSLFPAVLLLAASMTFLPVQNGIQGLTSFMTHVIPRPGLALLEPMLTAMIPHRAGLLSVGFVATLWLTSIGAKGIISALDIVYDVRTPRPLWINRILAFALTLVVVVLLVVGTVVILAGPALETLFSTIVGIPSLWTRLWPYFEWLLSGIITFAAIEILYILAPNVPVSRRVSVPGALVAAAIWLLLSAALGSYFHYLAEFKLNRFYGALSAAVALMIWLNWSAKSLLIGAQININLQSQRSLKLVRAARKTAAQNVA
jgi:membrane protein